MPSAARGRARGAGERYEARTSTRDSQSCARAMRVPAHQEAVGAAVSHQITAGVRGCSGCARSRPRNTQKALSSCHQDGDNSPARVMHILVPDTNFFLQCCDYETLDWSLVTSDVDVTIAVPRTVQREIDRHKDGGNARRASRARKASALFAQVIDSDDNRITKSFRGVTVSVELLVPKIATEDFPGLDLQNPDDQIVAEALWVKQQRPGAEVTFISNDTAALMTAKTQQLPFQRLPIEWMLPPEKDERDRTIDELRKTVARLSSQHPELAFTLPALPDKRVSVRVTVFPELTGSEIETVMDEIGAEFPMQSDFPQEPPARKRGTSGLIAAHFANPLEQWKPAGTQEIDHYQKKAYPEWARQVRSELENIHHRLNGGLLSTVTLVVANTGQQPAKRLLVTLQAQGTILFGVPSESDSDDTGQEKPLLPAPPTPPAGRYVNIADRFMELHAMSGVFPGRSEFNVPDLAGLWRPQRHDPNNLYWKPHRPAEEATEWTLECDEFRHQHEPYSLAIPFRPASVAEGTVTGAIRCLAHASNLPERVELVIPVRIHVERGDTLDQIREELFRLR